MLSKSLKIAFKALNAHKVRTALALLGITIGIATVIIVFSAGEGIKSLVLGQIESYGADSIQTEIKVPSSKKGQASERQSATSIMMGVQVTTMTLEDMEDISKLENIKTGYGAIMMQEPVKSEDDMRRTLVFGVSSSFIDIDKSEVEYGRFFTDAEDRGLAQVAVLGLKMKEKLFGESDVLGRSIKIRNARFKVIGVMKEAGAVMGLDFDDFIYIPVRSMQKRVAGINYIHYMLHQTHDVTQADKTAEQIRVLLRENHEIAPPQEAREGWADTGKDDFRVVTMEEMMDTLGTVTDALTYLLLAIVAISLIVGGVGVINVMYVIVNERTSEIGLRKAVGATYKNIMLQFLMESVLITLLGGVIGIVIGIAMSYLIFFGAAHAGFEWNFVLPIRGFVVALLFSLISGVLFGVFPARKAARMDPIDALRHE